MVEKNISNDMLNRLIKNNGVLFTLEGKQLEMNGMFL